MLVIPEGAYEIVENIGALPHFITGETDNLTMKTIMTVYREKDDMELKFVKSFFIQY